jgi:hypothetical protein
MTNPPDKGGEAALPAITEADRIIYEHRVFIAAILGGLYGLTTHPSDVPQNGCLISEASMEKLKHVYRQVLKEHET